MVYSKIPYIFLCRLPNINKILFFSILFFAFTITTFGQKTWDGGGDGINWSSANNWNPNGVPTALETVTISRNGALTINVNNSYSCSSLTINYTGNNNGTIALVFQGTNTLTVANTVALNNNAANGGSNIDLDVEDGTLNCSAITFSQSGSNTSDAYVRINNGVVNCSGDIAMSASNLRSYIVFTGTGTLYVGGDMSGGGITSTIGTGTNPTSGTVNYNGSTAQSVGNYTYYNLITSNSNTKTLAGAITVNNNLALQGTATLASDIYNITGNATGTFTMASGTTLSLGNTGSAIGTLFPGNFTTGSTSLNTNSTVIYQSTGAQTVSATPSPYGNLILATSGTKTMAGAISVNNNLSIQGSATLATQQYQITGNATGTMTMDAGSGLTLGATGNGTNVLFPTIFTSPNIALNSSSTVTYQAGGAQTVSIVPAYGNLIISGNGTTKTCSGNLTATGDLTISGTSILTAATLPASWSIAGNISLSGTLDFGTNIAKTITLGGNLTGGGIINMTGAGLAHTLNLGGSSHSITTLNTTASSGSTVNYFSTAVNTQIFASANYQNLTISGGNTKITQNSITVNGILNLSNGNLNLGSDNIYLNIADGATIIGSFDNTHMIRTDGLSAGGGLRIYSSTTAGFIRVYPVGTNTYYTPMQITSFSATLGAVPFIIVRAIPTRAPGTNVTDLNKYWYTGVSNLSAITCDFLLTYNPAEVLGNQSTYIPYLNAFPAPTSGAPGDNPMLITGATNINGNWTARETVKTLYSYQSGDWGIATTWTTDPSGTLSVAPAIPTAADRVVILNGRTIYTTNAKTVYSTQINEGGILDLRTSTGHDLGTVTGQGKLMLQTATFPGGLFTSFVASGGGTVEYYNPSADLQLTQLTYNNLIINLDLNARIAYILGDMVVNGNFTITRGNFRISDNNVAAARADLRIDILGDIIVASNGSFTVGTKRTNTNYLPGTFTNSNGNTAPFSNGIDYPEEGTNAGAWVPRYYDIYHKVRIAGNFTNNGTVKFISSAITLPNFASLTAEAAATVIFTGTSNSQLICNGTTDFYNLILDKGVDQTFVLTVDASTNYNFRLFGRNDMGGGGDGANPELRKALWIKNGTLRLTGSTSIATLAEGGSCTYSDGGPNSDFYIPANGALMIDGSDVTVLSTADDYREVNAIWNFAAPNNNTFNTDKDGCSSFSIRGKFTINDGYFSTRESGGFIFWPEASGTFIMNGGVVDAPQLRSAGGVDGLATFIQTGGTIKLRGQYSNIVTGIATIADVRNVAIDYVNNINGNSLNGAYGTFNIASPSNVMEMSGGTINIYNVVGGSNYVYDIRANTNNVNITGGTINILSYNNTNHIITTTGPVWDLNISRLAGTANVPLASDLTVLNDLTLTSGGTLDATATNYNLTVGGDYTISLGCTYSPNANTTTFNGSGSQSFNATGTITGNLQNLTLTNTSDLTLYGNNITINGNLSIGHGCTLHDNSRTIFVQGNIVNSGTHFKPVSGAGSIQLTGAGTQVISGDGTGSFNNLTLNKAGGITNLTCDINITGDLRLANTNARLFINSYALNLGAQADIYDNTTGTSKTNFSSTRMVYTNGLASDAGITKIFTGIAPYVFPYGFYNTPNTTYYYMPGSVEFSSAPTTYGSVTSLPVNLRHPLAQGVANSITCYWKTTSTGFTGIPAGTVRHRYYYDYALSNYFVQGLENTYIPAVYQSSTAWTFINNINLVNDATNEIYYNNASTADGEFTAGNIAAFTGVPVRYSTGVNGDWDNTATWSSIAVGGAGGASVPVVGTIVIIGDATHNHTVTINANNKACGSLNISNGSVLDIGSTNGHNFGTLPNIGVTGSGKLRIAGNNYFPQGDFGNFIGPDGGTVEYYTSLLTPANITIPIISSGTGIALTNYNYLILSPSAGFNITLPNTNLTVYSNLTISGAGNGANDGARTPAVTHTYTINGDLNVNSGMLEFRNAVVQTIRVLGNTSVAAGATFRVNNAGIVVNNILELYGNLTCAAAGTFDMNNTGRVYTYFMGTNNATISGTGTIDFYNLFVDKGTNIAPVLTCQSAITTGFTNPFLTLINGTFKVDIPAAQTITLTDAANFTIPSTACLSINQGTTRVSYGANNLDLLLYGKLEVTGGTITIGNSANNNNNDIEYGSSGSPIIDVSGGTLFVNGQIRRNTSSTSGALNYSQSGGLVTINGRNNQATRAKFEIANTNSVFNFSGGTMTIVRSGGTTYGDIYIRPDSYNITGGTLQIGDNTSAAGQTFVLSSSSPLWNITIGNSSVGQILQNSILPVTILNDLTINSGNSEFQASGFDVTIGRNLVNLNIDATTGIIYGGYKSGTTSQLTTFNGTGAQSITGNGSNLTNFANLTIAGSGSVALSALITNLCVNSNLLLSSGTLSDGQNTITVLGNIRNEATHLSQTGNGGILLAGPQTQIISGSGFGVFGNVILNNTNNINMIDNSEIDGRLTFTNGSLYIDDYLLTLGPSTSIGGSVGWTRMIILNGAISDLGVKKLYPSGALNFTFPIGVAGKYTPTSFNVSANSAPGTITVIPANRKHPAVTDALSNELAYYWIVKSTGFSSATLTHTYNYIQADVTGNESAYVCGRYNISTYSWTNLGDQVAEASNSITLSGVGYIDGEYTAGEPPNFVSKPILYSRNARPNNNWDGTNNWSSDPILQHAGASCGCYPQGNPVVIATGHTIVMNINSALAYSVEVNGILDCGTTVFHDLGHVLGTGTVIVTSTPGGIFVFPGGDFDPFFNTTNTTVELTGTNTASLPLKPGNVYNPYQNLILSGIGEKDLSADNMMIMGNLIIRNGTLLSNILYNKNIYCLGNWTDENNAIDGFIPGTGLVKFQGTNTQQFNVARTEQFYKFQVSNPNGINISGSFGMDISKYLYLTTGNIVTNGKYVTITNPSTAAVIGGSASSFVDGYLRKNITNGQFFNFPVGNGVRYGNVYISNTSGGTALWTASYYNTNPSPTYPTGAANLNLPITSVSNNEYWIINRPGASYSARIRLRWDSNSYPGIAGDPVLGNSMRVTEYEAATTLWSERGNIISGTPTSGTVSTSSNVTNNDYVFTLGTIGVTATITDLTPLSICDNGEIASIPVSLTGTAPWTLSYRTVGGGSLTRNFTQTGINNPLYNIHLTGTDMGGSGSSPYTLSLTAVSDNTLSGTPNASTVQIEVKQTYTPNITGAVVVGASEIRSYNTTPDPGSTYAWSWVGASGGSFNTATSNPTNITFTSSLGTYQLQLIETSSSGCTANDIQAIDVINAPAPDITPKTANICINDVVVYTTPSISGHTYTWTVVGGTYTGSGNSITVTWTTAGNGSVSVDEASGGVHGYYTVNVIVDPLPNTGLAVTAPAAVCGGSSANVTVEGSESGFSYQLRINTTDVGSDVTGTGGNINLPTGVILSPTTFNVLAYNNGCSSQLTATPTINITPDVGIPVFVLGATSSRCQAAGNITYTASATNTTGITYSLDAGTLAGGNSINSSTGEVTYVGTWTGTTIITASAAGCNGPATAIHTVTVNPLPSITTTGTISDVCYSGGVLNTTMAYTATTNNPTSYSIDWNAAANTAGLADQGSTAFAFAPGGGTVTGIVITAATPAGTYNGTMTISNGNGCTFTQAVSVTVNALPSITTTGTITAICYNVGAQNTTMAYSATTNTPNSYSINWDAAANIAGLADQGSTAFAFAAGGGMVTGIVITATTPAGTYNGTMIISNGNGCTSTQAVSVTINVLPSITTTGTITAICYSDGVQNTTMAYTATTNNPTSYSIDWNAAANTAGLADQGSTAFAFAAGGGTVTGIVITAATPAGTYNGTMTITNGNGCTATRAVSVTVNPLPDTGPIFRQPNI